RLVVDAGCLVVGHEIDELARVALDARERRVEAHWLEDDVERPPHLLERHARALGELGRRGLSTVLAREALLRAPKPLDASREVHGVADELRLVGERAAQRVANPPGCVGAEAKAAPMVE